MKISVDQIEFCGQDDVLKRIEESESSLFRTLINFLNMEIEIPITAIALTCILLISVLSMDQETKYQYPIIVIESGGEYEVY